MSEQQTQRGKFKKLIYKVKLLKNGVKNNV